MNACEVCGYVYLVPPRTVCATHWICSQSCPKTSDELMKLPEWVPERPTQSFLAWNDVPIGGWRDHAGNSWKLGRYLDGEWFRRNVGSGGVVVGLDYAPSSGDDAQLILVEHHEADL